MYHPVLSLVLLRAVLLVSAAAVPETNGEPLAARQESNNGAGLEARQGGCPAIWTDVTNDLKSLFNGCNDAARGAIRTSFHDCFPSSCDGSLILANECAGRPENAQMIPICGTLGAKAEQWGVSTADIIQAGAALGIVACGGPKIKFRVGRTDSSSPSPEGQLPAGTANAAVLVAAFLSRGFSAADLIALVGAHSTAKTLGGVNLDSTVSRFDNKFYAETQDGTAPASLPSDQFLANTTGTAAVWKGFATSSGGWTAAFVPAMERMSLIGNNLLALTDCSNLI